MNWFRLIGIFVALWGVGVIVYALSRSATTSAGGGAGAGTIPVTALFIGFLLIAAGTYAAVKGGRRRI